MSTVFLFHGIGGNSLENWFPWMKAELEKAKLRVIIPDFPNTDTPHLDEWKKHMEKYEDSIDDQTIFVGHSLGATFALRLLEIRKAPLNATILVASVTGPEDGLQYAPLMKTFTVEPFDWDEIKKNGGAIQMFHADNDPYISLKHAEALAENLDATIEIITGGRHLGASAGFSEFPLLLDRIKNSYEDRTRP